MARDHSKNPLRGRHRECGALDGLVEDAHAGRSRVLVLRGEAGIGKSSLLDHVAERAGPACRLARTTGAESETAFAFAGLHRLCAPMLEHLDRLPEPQRDALGTVFGLAPGPPPEQFLLGLAVLTLLTDVADDRPLVCLVDDAQWLDPSSASTLEFVARRLQADPVAMVFSVREPTEQPLLAGLPELQVGGIDDDNARSLLDSVTTGPLDERVRDRVVAEARGNPLALLELPRGFSTTEIELGFGSHDSATMANRIERGFLRQIEPLPPDTRRLLVAAAVEPLGDVTLLWRAAGRLGIDADAASPAEDLGVITLGMRVTFRHPLARSAVHRAASVSELRAVHAALAEATDAEHDPERRVWHRAQAAAVPDEHVASDLEAVALRAAGRGALVTAGSLLEKAMALTPDPARRGSRAVGAAVTKIYAAQFDSALQVLEAAELCPLEPMERATVVWLRAATVSAAKTAPGAPLFLEAAEILHPLDAAVARRAYLDALGSQLMAGRLDGEERLREVARAARAAPPAPEPPRPVDLVLDGLAVRVAEGYQAGLLPARHALAACLEQAEPNQEFLEWVWFAPLLAPEVWDDEAWDRVTAHTVRLNRDAGAFSTLPIALEYRAEFELSAGNLETAAQLVEEADTIVELTGRTPITHTSAELAAWRGDGRRAVEAIDATAELMAGYTGRNTGLAEHARAVLFNGLGHYEEALAAAQRACEHDDLGLYGRCLVERVEAGARAGAIADATGALRELEQRALAAGTDWALGVLARSRALLSDDADAEALYREALDRLGRTRMSAHLARAQLVFGEWLRRQNRRVDARAQLRAAHGALDAMGAAAFADRARRELLATGETVRKRSTDASDALTAQEAQIVRLAADGATNPEIGSRLFISPRTVEYHLSKIYVKLGVRSRRELRRVGVRARVPAETT
jgi:DNA-binding CsgD family transcriptional regulator